MKKCLDFERCYCLTPMEQAMIDYAIKLIVNNHEESEAAYVVRSIDIAVSSAVGAAISDQSFAEKIAEQEQKEQEELERNRQEEERWQRDRKRGEETMVKFVDEYKDV